MLMTIVCLTMSTLLIRPAHAVVAASTRPAGGLAAEQARRYEKVDRRVRLPRAVENKWFSYDEGQRLHKTVGEIVCREKGYPGAQGTAFLTAENEITTAGHLTIDQFGRQIDMSQCYFQNFDSPRRRVSILGNSPRTKRPTAIVQSNDWRDDRARLTLAESIKGVEPLQPDFDRIVLQKGDEIFELAADQGDYLTDGKSPTVSHCQVEDVFDPRDGVSRLKTACDSDHGASGGPVILRYLGQLLVKAITIAGIDLSKGMPPNGSAYDPFTNFQLYLVIDQDFLNWFND